MELPRLIVIGEKNINRFGNFLQQLNSPKKASIISGLNVKKFLQKKIERSLLSSKIKGVWHIAKNNEIASIKQIQSKVRNDKSDLIIGIGGGRSVDIAKMIAFNLKKPFVSLPTAASHDGIASPFVSVRSDKPHSIVASAPLGVFVDIDIIKKAPKRLLASGCGDLVANIIAVRDWELGRDKTGEYFGRYSANLASMSAKMLMENSDLFAKKGLDVRVIVEALTRLTSLIFQQNRGHPFIADILVGGYDQQGPALYNIDMFGSAEEKTYVTTGSGSPVAYGLLEEEYHKDLSVEGAKVLALRAVKAAITRNIGTGDGINISIINKNGFRLLSKEQKKAIIAL